MIGSMDPRCCPPSPRVTWLPRQAQDASTTSLLTLNVGVKRVFGAYPGNTVCIRWVTLLERRCGMFEAENIREWRGHDVVDSDGHKIGELEAVYVDTSTDLPAFGTVKVGMPTRHRLVFVPLARATVGPGYLKVAHDRKHVKDSPSISTDGELPAAGEEAIFKHYGLTYQAGASGERQLARR